MAPNLSQTQEHCAIFAHKDGTLSAETVDTPYTPSGLQSLVRVKYSGINPADIRHIYMGLYDKSSVTGLEWVGTVINTGKESSFSVGLELFGVSMPGFGIPRPLCSGAHQDFLLAERAMTWALPGGLDPKQAVALSLGLQTAADALLNVLGFAFEPAKIQGVSAKDTPILIWGGASNVGLSAIQIAKMAGFDPIFTTSSAKHHDTLRQLGVTECFDYHDVDVVDRIRNAVDNSGKQLSTVFDTIVGGLVVFDPPPSKPLDPAKSTISLARKCLSDVPEQDLRLCAVVPIAHDPTWRLCIGTRLEGPDTFGMPQDPRWPGVVESFMQWFLTNPKAFRHPKVTVVTGIDEGMRQVQRSFDGGMSLEKVIIAHPFTLDDSNLR